MKIFAKFERVYKSDGYDEVSCSFTKNRDGRTVVASVCYIHTSYIDEKQVSPYTDICNFYNYDNGSDDPLKNGIGYDKEGDNGYGYIIYKSDLKIRLIFTDPNTEPIFDSSKNINNFCEENLFKRTSSYIYYLFQDLDENTFERRRFNRDYVNSFRILRETEFERYRITDGMNSLNSHKYGEYRYLDIYNNKENRNLFKENNSYKIPNNICVDTWFGRIPAVYNYKLPITILPSNLSIVELTRKVIFEQNKKFGGEPMYPSIF